jgi:hypothetical protein
MNKPWAAPGNMQFYLASLAHALSALSITFYLPALMGASKNLPEQL